MNRTLLLHTLFAVISCLVAGPVIAQDVGQTGSRLGSSVTKNTVVWFDEPHQVMTIRHLLQEGRTGQAVELARSYAGSFTRTEDYTGRLYHYSALNALCAALTSAGDLAGAISTCDEAVALIPGRRQALNNRGTAYLLSGEYESALADYRAAMAQNTSNGPPDEVIEHNMQLAQGRLAADR